MRSKIVNRQQPNEIAISRWESVSSAINYKRRLKLPGRKSDLVQAFSSRVLCGRRLPAGAVL